MKYYNYDMVRRLPKEMRELLESNFNDDYGISTVIDNVISDVICITIDKVYRVGGWSWEWEHFANITKAYNGWEISENFIPIDANFCDKWGEEYRKWIGTEQTATNIYGIYPTFEDAIQALKDGGAKKKVKSVYV